MKLSAAVLVATLSACASFDDVQHPMAEGWRIGYVRQLGSSGELGARANNDCRRDDGQPDAGRYALISYPQRRTRRLAVIPLAPEQHIAQGQKIWFRLGACEAPQVG